MRHINRMADAAAPESPQDAHRHQEEAPAPVSLEGSGSAEAQADVPQPVPWAEHEQALRDRDKMHEVALRKQEEGHARALKEQADAHERALKDKDEAMAALKAQLEATKTELDETAAALEAWQKWEADLLEKDQKLAEKEEKLVHERAFYEHKALREQQAKEVALAEKASLISKLAAVGAVQSRRAVNEVNHRTVEVQRDTNASVPMPKVLDILTLCPVQLIVNPIDPMTNPYPRQANLESSKAEVLARQQTDVNRQATEMLGELVVATIRGTEVQAKVVKRNGPNLCLELGDGTHTWMHVEEVEKAGFEAWLLAGLGASSLPPPPGTGPASPPRSSISPTRSSPQRA